jgi:hypothetical protein
LVIKANRKNLGIAKGVVAKGDGLYLPRSSQKESCRSFADARKRFGINLMRLRVFRIDLSELNRLAPRPTSIPFGYTKKTLETKGNVPG